jgi:glyoxylase-like metal-dependent hydrolase (beta-lactamase superfamily II)
MHTITRYLGLAVLSAVAVATRAQPVPQPPPQPAWTTEFSKVQETVSDLGHGIYVLSPNIRPLAGNTTIAVGTDGLIVVDTQFAELYSKIKEEISGISKLPVKFVINTHHHGDHTGGNVDFGKAGAVIVAQANVAEHLGHPAPRTDNAQGKPMPAMGIPAVTYDGPSMTVRVGGQTARLFHTVAPAHSDGDSIIYFPEANVISTGDVFNSLLYPYIDPSVGGTVDGMISAIDQIAALANDQTRIVPGHGPISNKAGLAEYRAMLVTARDRIAKAKASGMTEQQVTDANLLADLNHRWFLQGSPVAERFPAIVYRALK